MRNPEERDASLALRSGRGNRLRRAVGWYRTQGRLHTGDPIAMAHDAEQAYRTAREQGKDVAIICDQWEIADAINRRLHTVYNRRRRSACDGGAAAAGLCRGSDHDPQRRRVHPAGRRRRI
jgi:hypothetical protein